MTEWALFLKSWCCAEGSGDYGGRHQWKRLHRAFARKHFLAAGFRVGCYTSPHLCVYNERIRTHATHISDASLIASFERVEEVRGDTSLTYFEFGTLAAFVHLFESELDVVILK